MVLHHIDKKDANWNHRNRQLLTRQSPADLAATCSGGQTVVSKVEKNLKNEAIAV